MNFYELQDTVWNMTRDYVLDECVIVKPEELGLDRRCGKIYVNTEDEVIAVHKDNRRNIEYYGGFEYIDSSCVECAGDYVFYTEHQRVEECFDYLKETV